MNGFMLQQLPTVMTVLRFWDAVTCGDDADNFGGGIRHRNFVCDRGRSSTDAFATALPCPVLKGAVLQPDRWRATRLLSTSAWSSSYLGRTVLTCLPLFPPSLPPSLPRSLFPHSTRWSSRGRAGAWRNW
eukprot:3018885-Rhodomonas_salina.3